MTHAVQTSTVDPAYSVEMHDGSYFFRKHDQPILEVPDIVREELEPTAQKWSGVKQTTDHTTDQISTD